ncbi:pentapeptide repeat-containing protein [Natrinema thermotolerans]|uniref:Pentapeptide repeat-containing protein n=1 Tax=Natrinema thermotolerans TaxID=121872 RepID=A0AAF0P898_9EURY|nr:pentapeptide repeat-containing protein [Natrinema thermotolerans]QCC59355.1 hypothetical protein DVR14_12250 [Natrinema thermotolerans]WMT06325.1 pentapeptide repeat-containing protein [Natrinema thermotolerans]
MPSKCEYEYSTGDNSSDDICERDCWRDNNRCIWHADVANKPYDELKEARKDGPERLDGAIFRGVDSGPINNSIARLSRKGELSETESYIGNSPIDFSGCSLNNSKFVDCRMKSTIFDNSDLSNSEFLDSNLHSSFFTDAILNGAIFRSSLFDGSEFDNSQLRFSTMAKSHFHRANFNGSNLTGMSIEDSHIARSNIIDCDLEGANISETTAYGIVLENTVIIGVRIYNSDFKRSRFECVSGERIEIIESNFPYSDILNCNYDLSELSNVDFTGTDLSNTHFFESALDSVDLSGSCLVDVDFEKSRLEDIQVDKKTEFGSRCLAEKDANSALSQSSLINKLLRKIPPAYIIYNRNGTHRPVSDLEKAIHIYGEYQRILRENALYEEIREYRVREKDAWRKKSILEGDFTNWNILALGRWSSKYGESPYRVIGISSLSILLFTVLYGIAGGVRIDSSGRSHVATLHFPDQIPPTSDYVTEVLHLIYFSSTTFSTLGYGDIEPTTILIRLLAAFQSLLGALLVALLLFCFSNRITR